MSATSAVDKKRVGAIKLASAVVFLTAAMAPPDYRIHTLAAGIVCLVGLAVPTLHCVLYFTKARKDSDYQAFPMLGSMTRLVILTTHQVCLVPVFFALRAWRNEVGTPYDKWFSFMITSYVFSGVLTILGVAFLRMPRESQA